jgi:hypothetical protein
MSLLKRLADFFVQTEPDPTEDLLSQASDDLVSGDSERVAAGRKARANLGRVAKANETKRKGAK